MFSFLHHETQPRIAHPFRPIPCRIVSRHLLRHHAGNPLFYLMSTLLILSGMALLALGTLVLGVAIISRRPMPPPEQTGEGDPNP
jgi:hypothetical protein